MECEVASCDPPPAWSWFVPPHESHQAGRPGFTPRNGPQLGTLQGQYDGNRDLELPGRTTQRPVPTPQSLSLLITTCLSAGKWLKQTVKTPSGFRHCCTQAPSDILGSDISPTLGSHLQGRCPSAAGS